jgi:hypothetical protein
MGIDKNRTNQCQSVVVLDRYAAKRAAGNFLYGCKFQKSLTVAVKLLNNVYWGNVM